MPGVQVVVADLGPGAGEAAYRWFAQASEGAKELGIPKHRVSSSIIL